MNITSKQYFLLLILHVLIGAAFFQFPKIGIYYTCLTVSIAIFFIIKNKNANHEALYAAAYLTGAEVFLRMNEANPVHEFGKYAVICFSILGIYYSGFAKKALLYLIFILLLVPGIFTAVQTLEPPIVPKIVFDLSGPICLGICSIYTYKKRLTVESIDNILLSMSLPIVMLCSYLYLYCPSVSTVKFTTESSFAMSGDFGPNQVSTILGAGIFLFFYRFLFQSPTIIDWVVNLLIMDYIAYRGIITFSRGGMLVSLLTILIFYVMIWRKPKKERPAKLQTKMMIALLSFCLVFVLISYQSKGFLDKRYTNKDYYGKPKKDKVYNRINLAKAETQNFAENPLGVGIGVGKQQRVETIQMKLSSHNEITRLLSEHGIFGLAALMILLVIPLLLYRDEKQNALRVAFFAFWLLTVSYTGMRIAAPSLMYALALLQIQPKKELDDSII